jgi:hypothetical protein
MARVKCLLIPVVGVLLMFTAARRAYAFEEPDGFGGAKFGMRSEEVKKLYPKMRLLVRPTPKAGEPKMEFPLSSYELDDQAVGPLKGCRVGFRFYSDALFEVQFRCPKEDAKRITAYLASRFGDPKPGPQSSLLWQGKTAMVTCAPKGKVFAFGDVERTKAMNMALMPYMMKFGRELPVKKTPAPQAESKEPLVESELLRELTVLAYGDPDFGDAPLTVHFTVDLAEELDEPVNPKFSWDFDDDSPRSHEREPTHVFKKPGSYKVRVKVTDAKGKSGGDDVQVDVDAPSPRRAPTATAQAVQTLAAQTPAAQTPGAKTGKKHGRKAK